MNITIDTKDKAAYITIEGRVDTSTVASLQSQFEPIIKSDITSVEIDCTQLEYTNSQGLRTFLMLQKQLMARGGELIFNNMNANVREVFDITGFSSIMTIR